MSFRIKIDGEFYTCKLNNYGNLPMLEDEHGRREWCIAESSETAGVAAREYWEEMANNDVEEFTMMVGKETLIAWALGKRAGPGNTHVSSLSEWLDLWLITPEEHFASYDGSEIDLEAPEGYDDEAAVAAALARMEDQSASEDDEALLDFASLVKELGFVPTVAYRHN